MTNELVKKNQKKYKLIVKKVSYANAKYILKIA